DRPHGQDVLQMAKATLHLGQLFVQGHRVLGGEVLLAGGHDILAFQTFLALQINRMVIVYKDAGADFPGVVTIAVMRPQGTLGGAPICAGSVKVPAATRARTFSSLTRVRAMACARLPCSSWRRSSESMTKTRWSASPLATSCTRVRGGLVFFL